MARDRGGDRRFSFADLMILVAATGAALVMLRPYLAAFASPGLRMVGGSFRTVETTYGVWSIPAIWLMATLLILQSRRPRPHRARLVRRPGYVACWVALVALAVGGVEALIRSTWHDPTANPFTMYSIWITMSIRIAPTIAGAWLLLALSGRWRADPGWIDRLGRVLGCCWIGWILFWLLPYSIRNKIPPFWDGVLL